MAYQRGSSNQIIVGAAALFTYEDGQLADANLPGYQVNESFRDRLTDYKVDAQGDEVLENDPDYNDPLLATAPFRNVGYTMNGLEIQFQPDFGEVQVDQVLDVAKLYKQGMQVNLNTAFAEATLENLLFAIAADPNDKSALTGTGIGAGSQEMNISAGDLGECPVERGLVAVGPGTGDCEAGSTIERVYVAYRALSIESVTVSAKRDEATMFEVSFRLLPNDNASYGKIVDRVIPAV
jgi:hypothetical protein